MIKIPECLDRRYKALDDIIQELSSSISSQRSLCRERSSTSNVGIKLMCDFWKILKEDPDCNLTEEVQERMGMEPVSDKTHNMYGKQEYMAYMAGKICCKDKKASLGADKGKCCKTASGSKVQTDDDKKLASLCCGGSGAMKTTSSTDTSIALTKVLCNLQEAASFDKKCEDRVKDLMDAQKLLKDQVQALEAKEKNGIQLLKQADCMWLCMEDAYKNKIKESQERQDILIKELKEIEASVSKWRKNKKDLEYQINNITKARMEIAEKMHQKKNDIKVMTSENHNLTKRLESAKKDLENSKNSISSTKQASDARIETLSADMKNIQKRTTEEKSHMKKKEEEGTQYVKEARADLQSICKVLLQKKLENEDLRAEKTAVLEEMDLLLTTLGTCQVRCKNKEESLIEELKAITKELATFEAKCKKCHICVDTNDVRKLCTDCPKCSEERKCNVDGEHCQSDPTMDCVCMAVKHKFLDNVFDNMYTVLERQSRTPGGKAVADAVLRALRRSTNGKLTADVRHILQEFVLSTVKKNLNLTIVGGAVKTRCELDAETYKQLMNCLKSVKAVKPKQEDKGTLSKKDPCKRWGASSECHCPKGPKDCICTRKAPPRPNDPTPIKQDKEDMPPPKVCPYRDPKICGPDCAMQGRSAGSTRDMGNEISTWRPDPCSGRDCPYNKDTRAAMAQCVLGFESMDQSMSRKNACTCNTTRLKSCHCHRDTKHVKVNFVQHCDKNTSVRRLMGSQKDVRFELPCVQQAFNMQTSANRLHVNQQYVNSVSCQFSNQERLSFDSNTKDALSKQFKVTVGNNSTQEPEQLTALSKTRSGTLLMELDEQTIKSLRKITNENPILFIILKKSDSGHLVLHFDNNIDVINDNTQKVPLRNTQSGTMFLEIHKTVIDMIEKGDKFDNIRYCQSRDASCGHSNNCLIDKSKYKQNDFRENSFCNNCSIIGTNSYNANKIKKISDTITAKNIKDYSLELQELFEQGFDIINVQVKMNKELCSKSEATITRSQSGTIGAELVQLACLGHIPFDAVEYPVNLSKTMSETYIVNIDQSNTMFNAVLKKSLSGNVRLLPTSLQANIIACARKTLFKIKVNDNKNCYVELPAVLKLTSSNNFKVVLNKEFETRYRKAIQNDFYSERECCLFLEKSPSGYVIDLNTSPEIPPENLNALLVKSESGDIKILVQGPVFERTGITTSKRSPITSAQILGELLDKLQPVSSTAYPKKYLKKSVFVDKKSASDTQLYERVGVKLQINKSLCCKPSAILKKTESGQYAIILNKESKKSFLDKLRSYLVTNPKGLVPITKTQSGDLLIDLNRYRDKKCHYGSLKITSSGNVYVVVDAETVETMTRNENKISTGSNAVDSNYVEFLDRGVGTTCKGKPVIGECDISKCLCEELTLEPSEWERNGMAVDLAEYESITAQNPVTGNTDEIYYMKVSSKEQYFFGFDPTCPYDDVIHEVVSNKFIKKSSSSKRRKNMTVINCKHKDMEDSQTGRVLWDSLKYLPPQLPPFLRNVRYREQT